MNYIECSCGGENQNCFRCTGSGLIFAEEDHKPVIKVLLSAAVSNEKNNE